MRLSWGEGLQPMQTHAYELKYIAIVVRAWAQLPSINPMFLRVYPEILKMRQKGKRRGVRE
jgi:type VI protein secretion system component VasF